MTGVVISDDALDAEVEYDARDSMIMDYKNRLVYLYGGASIKYTTLLLKADHIVLNLDSSLATAMGWPDSTGEIAGTPEFQDGDQSFTARRMRYNFKSQKGMVYDALTSEGDLYVLGEKTKFIGGGADSTNKDDVIYSNGAIITTCNHPIPHYGIRATKIKTVPNKVAVVGASNLELFGIPTPIWLPFGFYPVTPKNTAGPGLIFPKDFETSEALGFGLREVGYYFPVSDWADVSITGDIYFKGSWGLRLASNYVKKYKYRGNFRIGYSSRKIEPADTYVPTIQKAFSIHISHNQDSKAHPYRRIGGSINIQSSGGGVNSGYQSLTQNDARSVFTNSYSSNFSYSRTFPEKPYSLNVGFSHSQNTRNNQVTVNFPTVDFRVNRIYPFKSQKRVGDEKWFEKVSFQYSGNAKSTFFATDTTIFSKMTLDDAQFGLEHKMSTDMNFSLFKYINVTPSINYNETWFFKTKTKTLEFDADDTDFVQQDTTYSPDFPDDPIITSDTVNYGRQVSELIYGFVPFRDFSTSISMNTQLFATKEFRKGWLRGIRHIMKPTISYTYRPKTYADEYFRDVQKDIRDDNLLDTFSIFEGAIYSARLQNVETQAISFAINNIFEAKYYSKKDSAEKKLKLFDNLYMNGSYNIAADSFQFSKVSVRGTTRFFKGITTFSFNANYDPYGLKANGKRSTEYYIKTDNKLLRFENLSLRFNTRFTVKKIKALFKKESDKPRPGNVEEEQEEIQDGFTLETDFTGRPAAKSERDFFDPQDSFLDLFDNFSIGHNFVVNRVGQIGADTTVVGTHSINIQGSMQLAPNWRVRIGNIGYDFKSKRLTYPDIGFVRDLHCWELSFNWQPVRGTYSLYIGVKPGTLDFLKVPYRRNNVDGFGGF